MNTLDPILGLSPEYARDVVNFTCYPDRLQVREGTSYHTTTNAANDIEGLHVYVSVGGTLSLWATTDAGIFNVTTSGAFPAATVALTQGMTIGAVLSTGAQNYLTLVNGTDNMQQYDGATWTGTATVGGGAINTNTFSYVEVYRQRLYFIVKNTTRLVYLNANSVTGGGTNYDTAAIFRRGGYLVAMATWTIDGGTGPDDHLVLVTSEGEIAVFAGNDPATWSYKGTYYIARPLGLRPLVKFGGDLLLLCENGLYPLSKALLVATLDRSVAVTRKINPTITNAAKTSPSNWYGMVTDPRIPALHIVGPVGIVYTMNTQTGAWSTNSASLWGNILAIALVNGVVYMASNASSTRRVIKFAAGVDDLGQSMFGSFDTGFVIPKAPSSKVVKIQPVMYIPGSGTTCTVSVGVARNINDSASQCAITNPSVNSRQNTAWYSIPDTYSTWKQLQVDITTSNTDTFAWYGANLLVQKGGTLLNTGTAMTTA